MTDTHGARHIVVCRWDPVLVPALIGAGALVTAVIDEWEREHRRITAATEASLRELHVVSDFDSMPDLAGVYARIDASGAKVDAVVSASEQGQFAAGYLAALWDLDRTAVRKSVVVRDKQAMKAAAATAGVDVANHLVVVPNGFAAAERVDAAIGWPAVVKPTAGVGSVDTWIAESPAAFVDGLARRDPHVGHVLVEEYVAGDEYHVDALWAGGECVALGIGRYLVPRIEIDRHRALNGTAHLRRAEHRHVYAALEPLVERVVRALGIHDGVTHMEFFHRPDGRWTFSEAAHRPGAGGTAEAFAFFGGDLRELWASMLADPRRRPGLGEPPAAFVGSVSLAPDRAGVIEAVPDEDRIRALPYVLDVRRGHEVGEIAPEFQASAWSWSVFLEADSWEQFVGRAVETGRRGGFRVASPIPPASVCCGWCELAARS